MENEDFVSVKEFVRRSGTSKNIPKVTIKLLSLLLLMLLIGCDNRLSSLNKPTMMMKPNTTLLLLPPKRTSTPTITETVTATDPSTLTSTSTPEPTMWGIAKKMLSECEASQPFTGTIPAVSVNYIYALYARIYSLHPEFLPKGNVSNGWVLFEAPVVFTNDGINRNTFGLGDILPGVTTAPSGEFAKTMCQAYVLALQDLPDNGDGDGVLVGEAYLFCEVGGTSLTSIDGEVKEIHINFPYL